MSSRRGFALIAVLWIVIGASALGMGIAATARGAIATADNRRALRRAGWRAEECEARARSDLALRARLRASGRPPAEVGLGGRDCAPLVTLEPVGTRIDVNRAPESLLRRLFTQRGLGNAKADSLAAAILDWRDSDDRARPFGAERDWYRARDRLTPRDTAFADIRELRAVRGYSIALDSVLTVEPGRVAIGAAPEAVLQALPGMSPELMMRLREARRARAVETATLLELAGTLSPEARETLGRGFAELNELATTRPDGWLLRVRVQEGRVTLVSTVRLVDVGDRYLIVSRQVVP